MTTEIVYISAGLVAWLSLLGTIWAILAAKNRAKVDLTTVSKSAKAAASSAEKATKISTELEIEIEKLKQRQVLFEESLQSFTNRINARNPRKKDSNEVLAEELMKQAAAVEQGDEQQQLQFPNGKRKLVPIR